jgi:hypothetical protein
MAGTCIAQQAQAAWSADPDLMVWMDRSRLNAACGVNGQLADPAMQSALGRMFAHSEPAVAKLEKFLVGGA